MIINALDGYEITYPVVFDWETAEGYRTYSGLSKSEMTAIADTFCSMVEAAGYKAMIYANTVDWERYYASELNPRYGAWLARYPENYTADKRFKVGDGIPSLAYPYQIWQYSETGHVDGIEENVDMNVGFIDFNGFEATMPVCFSTPLGTYRTSAGSCYDILADVCCYNSAGIGETSSMKVSIFDNMGNEVSLQDTSAAGLYQVVYSLTDFTGYTGSLTVPLYVEAPPAILLTQTSMSVSAQSVTPSELQTMICENVIDATDFTGFSIKDYVTVTYPAAYYEVLAGDSVSNYNVNISGGNSENSAEQNSEQESGNVPVDETTSPEQATEELQTTINPEEDVTQEAPLLVEPENRESENSSAITRERLIPGIYQVIYSVTDAYHLTGTFTMDLIITD